MRLFGFEVRRVDADPVDTPRPGPTYAYTPEDRVRAAYRDARIILEHLMRGRTASRREMQRTGMSERRWNRATQFLSMAGVLAVPRSGEPLELVVLDGVQAGDLLRQTRQRLLHNVQSPTYTLPF